MQSIKNTGGEVWTRYWNNRDSAASGSGSVLENDNEFSGFWRQQLGDMNSSSSVLELACGAGPVLRLADTLGFSQLSGVDIAPNAIALLNQAIPSVNSVVASAAETGLCDNSFDLIVSQFGIEYSPHAPTAKEIHRLLKKGGKMLALCHHSNGLLASEDHVQYDAASQILDSGFIPAFKAFLEAEAAYKQSQSPDLNSSVQAAAIQLQKSQQSLVKTVQTHPNSIAAHLYQGSRSLFERRQSYNLQDILNWFDQMDVEVSLLKERMASMLSVSMDETSICKFTDHLEHSGLNISPTNTFQPEECASPLAWIVEAYKA